MILHGPEQQPVSWRVSVAHRPNPRALRIALSGLDGHLLTHYFTVTNPAGFTDAQQVAVSGYQGQQAWYDAANQAGRTDPVPGRVDVAGYASAVWNDVVPVALRKYSSEGTSQ